MSSPTAVDGGRGSRSGARTVETADAQQVGLVAKTWRIVSAVVGTLMGLLPHVLHHAVKRPRFSAVPIRGAALG